jgi:hypothetical protein
MPSAEKWLLCDSTFLCLIALGILQMTSIMTNPSSSLAKSRRVIKYNVAIYSLVGAIVVLVLGAILKGSTVLPIFVIGIMAIVCMGQVILDVKRHPHHRFSKS